jgi:hypothetical protein
VFTSGAPVAQNRSPRATEYFLAFSGEKILYHRLGPIVHAKFVENVFQMRPNGRPSNEEAFADFHVGITLGDQDKDFSFPVRY